MARMGDDLGSADHEARRAINDLHNNIQHQLQEMVGKWGESMIEYTNSLEGVFTDIQTKILMMDEALAHIATRLDQIEGTMGLESLTALDTTAEEEKDDK
jgi:hypothetical protein